MIQKQRLGEAGTSQLRHKKGNMSNIYLTDSDAEAIVDFVKDHKELYDKTNEHFKDKARKDCLWERFANSCKLSVKVCKTWFESQRTCYSKFTQSKSGQAPKEMVEHQNWIPDKFGFLKLHIRYVGLLSGFKSHAQRASASAASAHDIFRASTNTDSMEISMWSTDTTLQSQQVTSATTASGRSWSTVRLWTSSQR